VCACGVWTSSTYLETILAGEINSDISCGNERKELMGRRKERAPRQSTRMGPESYSAPCPPPSRNQGSSGRRFNIVDQFWTRFTRECNVTLGPRKWGVDCVGTFLKTNPF